MVLTIPKRLRAYGLYRRRLLGEIALAVGIVACLQLTWPHSGLHVCTALWVPWVDRAFATRLARYGARHLVARKAPPVAIPAPGHAPTEVTRR